jgi:peptidoglycan hydrolase-like amidase
LFITAPLQKIDGTKTTAQQVINIVSLDNYMRGVAEASDSEAQTKTNVLALLSKAYIAYYLGGATKHPNIPEGALYNAIDDPRLFQKYLGQGRESISKNRPKALAAMKNTYITYN